MGAIITRTCDGSQQSSCFICTVVVCFITSDISFSTDNEYHWASSTRSMESEQHLWLSLPATYTTTVWRRIHPKFRRRETVSLQRSISSLYDSQLLFLQTRFRHG